MNSRQKPSNQNPLRKLSLRSGLICLLFSFFLGCHPQLMPTPNLYVQTDDNPFADVKESFQNNFVDIFYATDRQPTKDKNGKFAYGYQRSNSLAYGNCRVQFGDDDLSWEQLVQQSRQKKRSLGLPIQLIEIEELGRFPDTPLPLVKSANGQPVSDPNQVKIRQQMASQAQDYFRQRLAATDRKEAYLFIHGFNNNFQDSAFVIAQIWHFLGREGVPLCYSWPAGIGGLRGYFHDRESGEFTLFHLKNYLKALAATEELEKIHIIAHSRGTDVIMSALRELHLECKAAGLDTRSELKLGNLILAAADLDLEVVRQRIVAERVHLAPQRFTLYMSPNDRALGLSDWLFDSVTRLGKLALGDLTEQQKKNVLVIPSLHLIDTQIKTDFIGHSYFYANPAVSSDLILLLRDNRDPGLEHGRPLLYEDSNFWMITDSYPNVKQN